MEMEIKRKTDNKLLKRTEVEFVLHHAKGATPKRDEVRDLVAKQLRGKKENVVVDSMESEYGRAATRGYAKLYESAEQAKKLEPNHILVRNKLAEKKVKAAPPPAAAKKGGKK